MSPLTEGQETGVREIDAGNEGLQYLLQRLFAPLVECRRVAGPCDFRACTKIQAIIRYTGRNFAGQEAVMTDADYPNGNDHQRHHASLLDGLKQMQAECVCAERDSASVRAFIARWTTDHLQRCDRPFGRWAVTRRVLPPVA
jgi:hemerythrin-like metal-binding protein